MSYSATKRETHLPGNLMDLESSPEYARKAIREMIGSREIALGQRIDQRELAKKLELTTVPVREALCWLEAEGLVKWIPGRGVFCKTYTVDDVQELVEIRGALESLAAGLAAERVGQKQKEALLDFARRMTDEPGVALESFLEKHMTFHRMVVEFSGSETLLNIWNITHITDLLLVRIGAHIWPEESRKLHNHVEIAEAVCNGDRGRAEQAMRQHTISAFQERLRALRKEYGDAPIL